MALARVLALTLAFDFVEQQPEPRPVSAELTYEIVGRAELAYEVVRRAELAYEIVPGAKCLLHDP